MADSLLNVRFALVDDNEADIFFAEILLKREGASAIQSFPGGQEFIDAVHGGLECDIIFMDIRMPIMDGFETIDTLSAEGAFERMGARVFMISAATNSEDIERSQAADAIEGLYQKPLTPMALAEMNLQ
ncbi:MAG: response regulator [Pseudomonadota bacterium]